MTECSIFDINTFTLSGDYRWNKSLNVQYQTSSFWWIILGNVIWGTLGTLEHRYLVLVFIYTWDAGVEQWLKLIHHCCRVFEFAVLIRPKTDTFSARYEVCFIWRNPKLPNVYAHTVWPSAHKHIPTNMGWIVCFILQCVIQFVKRFN